MSARRIFTDEQVEFIRENIQTMSTRECARAFSEFFSEPLGQTELRRVMARNGIQSSKKRNDFAPIGTERYSEYYQCMMVKVGGYQCHKGDSRSERDYKRNANWKLKQNLVWEQANGKELPWRWVVVLLDGDRMNYNPDNLYAVPLNVAGTIEKMRMHSENAEIYKTALIWGKLYYAMRGALNDE